MDLSDDVWSFVGHFVGHDGNVSALATTCHRLLDVCIRYTQNPSALFATLCKRGDLFSIQRMIAQYYPPTLRQEQEQEQEQKHNYDTLTLYRGDGISEAIVTGNVALLRILLTLYKGLPPTAFWMSLDAAVNRAIARDDVPILTELLKEKMFAPQRGCQHALRYACESRSVGVVRLLLKHPYVTLSVDDHAILIYVASRALMEDILPLLLEYGRADPCRSNQKPLVVACEYGRTFNVKCLLADPRVHATTKALRAACQSSLDTDAIIRMLCRNGAADPTQDDNRFFRRACEARQWTRACTLLEDGRVRAHANQVFQTIWQYLPDDKQVLLCLPWLKHDMEAQTLMRKALQYEKIKAAWHTRIHYLCDDWIQQLLTNRSSLFDTFL